MKLTSHDVGVVVDVPESAEIEACTTEAAETPVAPA